MQKIINDDISQASILHGVILLTIDSGFAPSARVYFCFVVVGGGGLYVCMSKASKKSTHTFNTSTPIYAYVYIYIYYNTQVK